MIAIEPLNERGRARHKCEACGLVTAPILPASAAKVRCKCWPIAPYDPTRAEKAANLFAATRKHVASGLSMVTPEVRAERLAICEGCELYDGKICRHKKCGCPIGAKRKFFDKLSWASSSCPLEKWTAEAEPLKE